MITPRYFEEYMLEIENAEKTKDTKILETLKLMADTLDTHGYAAGTKIARRIMYADERYEE